MVVGWLMGVIAGCESTLPSTSPGERQPDVTRETPAAPEPQATPMEKQVAPVSTGQAEGGHPAPCRLEASPTWQECLLADRAGLWVYRRRDLHQPDARPGRYVRNKHSDGLVEGLFFGRTFLPLDTYLDLDEPAPDQSEYSVGTESPTTQPIERPKAPIQGGTAIFARLATGLPVVPEDLRPGEHHEDSSELRYYDYLGNPKAKGTLTRTVEHVGIEEAPTPTGTYEQCHHVKVELRVRLPWVLAVDLDSDIWLSPQAGEVKRVQRFSGWFFIFYFVSEHAYELILHRPRRLEEAAVDIAPEWKTLAIVLRGQYPRIRLSGMVVDYAVARPRQR